MITSEQHSVLPNTHNTADHSAVCSLCLEAPSSRAFLLPCRHAFDIICIKGYFFKNRHQQKPCPICGSITRHIEMASGKEWISVATRNFVAHPMDNLDSSSKMDFELVNDAEAEDTSDDGTEDGTEDGAGYESDEFLPDFEDESDDSEPDCKDEEMLDIEQGNQEIFSHEFSSRP
jgi:hypothetical protein